MSTQRFNKLIRRIRENKQALNEIYKFYYPLIVIHINRCFRGKLDGRDIAHQLFVKLFRMEITEYIRYPTNWVYQIAYYTAIETLRKNDKRKTAELKTAADYKYFDVLTDGTEILGELPEREKKIMYLRYWENYRLKEIAVTLEMNYSTVKSAHKKAKTILKKSISKEKNQ